MSSKHKGELRKFKTVVQTGDAVIRVCITVSNYLFVYERCLFFLRFFHLITACLWGLSFSSFIVQCLVSELLEYAAVV